MAAKTDTRGAPESGTDPRYRFWLRYLRLGFVVLGGEGLGAAVYFGVVPSQQHRIVLVSLAVAGVALAIGALPFLSVVANKPWRARFSFGAALASTALLTAVCAFDGGADSPLLYLQALPVLNAALALPMRHVVMTSGAMSANVGVLFALEPSTARADITAVAAVLLLGGVVAVALLGTAGRTELEAEELHDKQELARLAVTDSLTGCLNNKAFYTRVDEEVQRYVRTGEAFSLLIADVDRFKSYNDTFGHEAGDTALQAVAGHLRRNARAYDTIGRVGGDEFAILMPSSSGPDASQLARRILDALRTDSLGLSLSIGHATVDGPESTVAQLVRHADAAMYAAKAQGRASAVGFDGQSPRVAPADPATSAQRGLAGAPLWAPLVPKTADTF